MSRRPARAVNDHRHAAEQARQMPGQWVLAGTYSSSASAMAASLHVRTADRLPVYRPAGAFEARTQVTQDGADLWVRYTAPAAQASCDFQASLDAGLTESFDDFSHRLATAPEDNR